jgi:hypothetical protein
MADAETNFRKLLSKQSRSLKAAVKEYKKRYHRDPPKGFDKWWKFVVDNKVKMVDEYDGLVEDLAPFWEISGEELRRRAGQVCLNQIITYVHELKLIKVALLPSMDLVRVVDGKATAVNVNKGFTDSAVSARANGFRRMMEKFQNTVCFMIPFSIPTRMLDA